MPPPLPSLIYVVARIDRSFPAKVGVSSKPIQRLRALRVTNRDKSLVFKALLEVYPTAYSIENDIKWYLNDLKVPGRSEWFRIEAQAMIDLIKAMADSYTELAVPEVKSIIRRRWKYVLPPSDFAYLDGGGK